MRNSFLGVVCLAVLPVGFITSVPAYAGGCDGNIHIWGPEQCKNVLLDTYKQKLAPLIHDGRLDGSRFGMRGSCVLDVEGNSEGYFIFVSASFSVYQCMSGTLGELWLSIEPMISGRTITRWRFGSPSPESDSLTFMHQTANQAADDVILAVERGNKSAR